MSLMIFIFGAMLITVGVLLFQISLKYRTWVTTLTIVFALSISCLTAVVIYENLGYPKEIHILPKKWIMHHYVASDEEQKFYVMIQEGEGKPRLVAFKISSKENYEKQKKGLKGAKEGGAKGQLMEGAFDSDSEEFRFHKLNLQEIYKKESP